ncbi:hypothetical protein KR074_001845 [Drosophila pseudoananassae]|nr:hypothetical protein KR074_001845 [Drosophila pseudoananassae]
MVPVSRRTRIRRSLAHFTLRATLYGSWVLGLFPFTFDSKKKQLRRSRWLLAYGVILNTILLILSFLPATDDHNWIKEEVFKRNPLVQQVEFLVEIIGLASTGVIHLRTFWRSKDLVEILNELLRLERRHFRRLTLGDCVQFERNVLYKGLIIFLELGSSLAIYFGIPESKVVVREAICIYLVQLEVLLVVMHFHLAVIYIYRFVWIINRQLLSLANQLRGSKRVDPDEVLLLLQLYSRLVELNDRIASIYDVQMILFMTTMVSANITIAYVMVIMFINARRFSLWVLIIFFPQALIINCWDLWQGIASCDLAENTGRKTSTILKLFNDIRGMDKELEQRISEFTLFCSHRRLRYRHCGLFSINYEIGFQIIVTNILYVLFLVQFDYMNLKYK